MNSGKLLALEELCCRKLSENMCFYTTHIFQELNRPCLRHLVHRMSLHDILEYEPYFKQYDIDTDEVLGSLRQLTRNNLELHSLPVTTLPHLLQATPPGWRNALSRLLSRRVLGPCLDEHFGALKRGDRTRDHLKIITHKYWELRQLYIPNHLMRHQEYYYINRSQKEILKFCVIAAAKVLSIQVDIKLYTLVNNPMYAGLFHALCQSLMSISVLVVMNRNIVELLEDLRNEAKRLDTISLICLKGRDLKYFDEIMSRCSGVVCYYETDLDFKKKKWTFNEEPPCGCVNGNETLDDIVKGMAEEQRVAECKPLWSVNDATNIIFDDYKDNAAAPPQEMEIEDLRMDFSDYVVINDDGKESEDDLMDDVILGGMTNFPIPSDDDTFDGVANFTLKVTNQVPYDLYAPVIDHHFKHWMALKSLTLSVPKIDGMIANMTCVLIQRPSFKSLCLSDAEIKFPELEEILACVALYRKQVPLDELLLVNLDAPSQPSFKNTGFVLLEDFDEPDYLPWHISKTIGAIGSFTGTKTFEISGGHLDVTEECVVLQFLTTDTAIEKLYFNNNALRKSYIIFALRVFSEIKRPLTHLIIEDCCFFNSEDRVVISEYLDSAKDSLVALSLKGSFCFIDHRYFDDTAKAIGRCHNLKSLDMSNNAIGRKAPDLFTSMHKHSTLKEICLRNNRIPPQEIVWLFNWLSNFGKPPNVDGSDRIERDRPPPLDILDLRGNLFYTRDMLLFNKEILNASVSVLCDEGYVAYH